MSNKIDQPPGRQTLGGSEGPRGRGGRRAVGKLGVGGKGEQQRLQALQSGDAQASECLKLGR